MAKVFFHPDISYQDIKKIEARHDLNEKNHLVYKASRFVTDEIIKFISKESKILIVCGPGYNGLDGIFVANNLHDKNYDVSILISHESAHDDYILKYKLSKIIIENNPDFNDFNYVIDCIFGYGLNRQLDTTTADLVKSINESSSYIISVDVPTGLDSCTGSLLPISINCDLLITLLSYKKGLFTHKGRDTWKNLLYSRLIDDDITANNYLVTANDDFYPSLNKENIIIKDFKKCNQHSTHKKSNGVSCIVAGEFPYHGALIMSCHAAIKTGCQYLHSISEEEYAHSLPIILPEVISTSFSHSDFNKEIKQFSNVLIGPGITTKGKEYVNIALDNLDNLDSLIIDAGGLSHINTSNQYSKKLIITPHPGEAAKLLSISPSEVQADRYQSAMELYNLLNCIVVLKGSGTIIYDGKNFYTCMDGNYNMAVAGMGDILSGILLRELSSPLDRLDACLKSVVYHSYSSDYLLTQSRNKNYRPSMIPETYSELTSL